MPKKKQLEPNERKVLRTRITRETHPALFDSTGEAIVHQSSAEVKGAGRCYGKRYVTLLSRPDRLWHVLVEEGWASVEPTTLTSELYSDFAEARSQYLSYAAQEFRRYKELMSA